MVKILRRIFRNPVQRFLAFLWAKTRSNLIAGLLFLIPLVGTYFFIRFLIRWVDKSLLLLPAPYRPDNFLPFNIPGLGLILVFIILLVTGFIVRNFMGRKLVSMGERIMSHIPFVSKFYRSLKQLVETIFKTSTGRDFKRVVLVEYPRKETYALAFVTGVAMGEIQRKTDKHCINLFVPTTPNPTSGFYLLVPEDDVIPLDMGVEDAFKLLISGGILNPEEERAKQAMLKKAPNGLASKEDKE